MTEKSLPYARFWREVRRERGLTQQRMGDLLGIRFQFISAVERGSGHYSVTQMRHLIRRLKLNPGEVVRVVMAHEERKVRAAFVARKKKILRA